jgi:5-methylcytosine-specific restriction enzyme A
MSIKRLEIPKPIKLEVFKRAGGPDDIQCEGCGLSLRGKRFAYDHQIPEWMRTAPRSERTIIAADVKLLGEKCCHAPKTAKEASDRAHGNRIIEKSAGIKRKTSTIPGTRASGLRKRMDGTVERWS